MVCGILVPRPGIKPMLPAVEARSLNHRTTREAPRFLNIYSFKPAPILAGRYCSYPHIQIRTLIQQRGCVTCPWQQPVRGRADDTNLHTNRLAAPPRSEGPCKADPRHFCFISMVAVTQPRFWMEVTRGTGWNADERQKTRSGKLLHEVQQRAVALTLGRWQGLWEGWVRDTSEAKLTGFGA